MSSQVARAANTVATAAGLPSHWPKVSTFGGPFGFDHACHLSGLGAALGRHAGGNSLDNTLRIRRIVPTDWVLCDIRMLGVHGGFAHGAMYLYARDGELMATGSQSLIVRIRESAEDR